MQKNENKPHTALSTWALDREIVLSRVINAPRESVFAAWSNPQSLSQWFGPVGFEIENKEVDIRVGGRWRFDMIAPDGTRYASRMTFLCIELPTLIVCHYGLDQDEDPDMFHMTITFDEQSNGKTVVTLRQLHPTKVRRDAVMGFGAVEFGYQTLDKLAGYVGV